VNGRGDPDLSGRKVREAAIVLPVAGVFLLMPPVIHVFATHASVAGIPIIIVYLFAVWFALIICAWRLAGPLHSAMHSEGRGTGETDPPEG
jgi:hypothetical protein